MGKGGGAGGRLVQRRATRHDGWTKAVRATFLARLAETCNVTASCAAVARSMRGVYALKARDPVFADAFAAALEHGYQSIEAELMHRALGDKPELDEADAGDESGAEGADELLPFDPILALDLLKLRQNPDRKGRRRRSSLRPPSELEVLAALDRKLTALERQLGRGK